MLAKQIGANIRAARKARRVSLVQLAEKMVPKTTYQQLSRLEDAQRPITMDWVERIATALETDPMELLAPELLLARPPDPSALILNEQVADQAARTLLAPVLGPDPNTGTVQVVAGLLRDLVALFSAHPEAATDPRVARPAIDLASSRLAHAGN